MGLDLLNPFITTVVKKQVPQRSLRIRQRSTKETKTPARQHRPLRRLSPHKPVQQRVLQLLPYCRALQVPQSLRAALQSHLQALCDRLRRHHRARRQNQLTLRPYLTIRLRLLLPQTQPQPVKHHPMASPKPRKLVSQSV
jgi:hypothetical protein